MKNNFLAALAALITCAGQAQPVVNASNVSPNLTADFLFTQADGFDPGQAGANQTWDFSGLNLTQIGTDAVIPVTGSPFAATFPTANYLYKFHNFFGGSDRYYYHLLTQNKFEILALAYNGQDGDNYAQDPRTFMEFPYSYNQVYTDTYRAAGDSETTNVTATYDAYGTVIMPYGTFTNVIRQKVVTNGVTDYIWFNVQPFYPILQTVLAENSLGITRNTTVLGVPDQSKNAAFTSYPNPTEGAFTISANGNTNPEAILTIYNALGQRVFSREKAFANGNNLEVSLQGQPSGIYFASLTDGGALVYTQKIVKK